MAENKYKKSYTKQDFLDGKCDAQGFPVDTKKEVPTEVVPETPPVEEEAEPVYKKVTKKARGKKRGNSSDSKES